MTSHVQLTDASLALFKELVEDAPNWSGTPLVDVTNRTRGNLADLKKKGLLSTEVDEDNRKCVWAYFTESGKKLADSLGYDGYVTDVF